MRRSVELEPVFAAEFGQVFSPSCWSGVDCSTCFHPCRCRSHEFFELMMFSTSNVRVVPILPAGTGLAMLTSWSKTGPSVLPSTRIIGRGDPVD